MPQKFYAVVSGRNPGVYTRWPDAKKQIVGYSGASHKSFSTLQEAQEFLDSASVSKPQDDQPVQVLPVKGRTIIYTDGSAKDRKTGYGVIGIKENGERVQYNGPVPNGTTNNQAELYAIKIALEEFSGPLTIYSDSEYTINCLTVYIHNWKRNGWKSTRGQKIKNREWIEPISQLLEGREDVEFVHVRAHSGFELNELADQCAKDGRVL